ncbi:MAG: hypothetical protein AUH96_11300 [Nitrospirae bacterium 13_2_20CM_2_61_4]|nr:MAG: hypothetical protein AUH96_11300 [Nitrospirae bacterium 13_2_20CM_2_61_4]
MREDRRGPPKARAAVRAQIEAGQAHIVIGTHALIQKGVRFAQLGLAVIDEQHKFGVLQRKTLLDKGYHPDVLVLTATPIPRTLAMTVYGDLDVSVIDALPPGRIPVRTWLFSEAQRRRAYQLVQDEMRAGRQGYIVYPLVEESEKVDLQAAIQGAERLQAQEFRSVRVGLLHGRMKTEEKERTMAAFKKGEIPILVATTVIEVGVDIPNATVMLVEHAERFGLAQLHQLRGRVGRGTQQSYCLLLASGIRGKGVGEKGSEARQRLEALVNSTDGFVIAEEDLRIRGPGEFFGVRQWGVPEFRAANLIRDAAMLEQARQEAFALVKTMGVVQRMKHDLKTGWAALRYGTAKVAGRALEETERLQLRLEVRKLDERMKDVYRDIGERAVELHERGEPVDRILADLELANGAEQVSALKAEREKLMRDMDDLRSGG